MHSRLWLRTTSFYKQGENSMPQYMIAYLGGDQPPSPEEGKK